MNTPGAEETTTGSPAVRGSDRPSIDTTMLYAAASLPNTAIVKLHTAPGRVTRMHPARDSLSRLERSMTSVPM